MPSSRGVHPSVRVRSLLTGVAILMALATASPRAAESGRRTFVLAWEHRTVVLTQRLYSLVFDQRSRYLPVTRRNRVVGLTVAGPSDTRYVFESRREDEEDIVERDPETVVDKLRTRYRRSAHLDISTVREIEPVTLMRFDPGVAFIVSDVQMERSRVRLLLRKDGSGDVSTTLTVQWPAPLSQELTEASLVDDVLARFVVRR